MAYNDNICKLRKLHGFTQSEIASRLSIERTTYTRYESGEIRPSIDTIIALADIFGVSIDYLLGHNTTDSAGAPPQNLQNKDESPNNTCFNSQLLIAEPDNNVYYAHPNKVPLKRKNIGIVKARSEFKRRVSKNSRAPKNTLSVTKRTPKTNDLEDAILSDPDLSEKSKIDMLNQLSLVKIRDNISPDVEFSDTFEPGLS